jgi:hypothetical protein
VANKAQWELTEGFFAYYYNVEHPARYSVRDVAAMLNKEKGTSYSKNTIDRMVDVIQTKLDADPEVKGQYEQWKQGQSAPKHFYKVLQDGKIDSPYAEVREKVQEMYANRGYIPRALMLYLSKGEKFWVWTGRKKPADWTKDDYFNYMGTIQQGSKFATSVAIAQFSKVIRDIPNRTKGLKGEPRRPALMKSNEFPKIWQDIKAKCLEITPAELRPEMEFVLTVKPAIGARTGSAITRKGLWGTKIGDEERTQYGLASYIQIVGKEFHWTLNEKGNEIWEINFLDTSVYSYIYNYVKQRKKGEFLLSHLTEAHANQYLRQACEALEYEPLRLHDMRKMYVSFLVKAGIPLEQAIRLNVGWKDIGTAYKHYLIFVDLGEKQELYRRNMGALLKGQGVAAS